MRYPASEKAKIIKFVEQSHLSAHKTLALNRVVGLHQDIA